MIDDTCEINRQILTHQDDEIFPFSYREILRPIRFSDFRTKKTF